MHFPHLKGRFGRRRGWRRRFAALALLAIVGLAGAYFYLANPQRLSGYAASLLRDMTGAEVAIDAARFGIDGKIHLHGLRLRVPNVPGEAGRLFEAAQVTIDHELTSLLRGRFKATSLVVFGPTLVLTQDVATDRYNYQILRESRSRESSPVPSQLPDVFVRHGVIEFAELEDGRYLPLGQVQIDGKLTQITQQPGAYFFALRQMAQDRPEAQLTGRFNLKDLSVSAELDRFSFNNPYGSILPRKLRTWWQDLDPTGSLPMFRIAYDPDPAIGLHAVIEVRDVELSLPYTDSTEDGTKPVFPRMRGVSGTFAIVRDTVMIDELRGTIEGIGYQIDGNIQGLDRDAPFSFVVRTNEFEIPADRTLYSLPRPVEKELRRFSPSGKFLVTAAIERHRRGGLIDYRGALSLIDVDARYWQFPYPLEDVHGTISFTNKSIDVENLDGHGPNGGRVVVKGSIAPPGDGAAVTLDIDCTDLPVDEHVLNALEPKYRKVIDMLGDYAQHARMVNLGVISSTAVTPPKPRAEERPKPRAEERLRDEAPDGSHDNVPDPDAKPTPFDLGGKINLHIHVNRNLGLKQPYVMNATIDVAGVNMMFRYWPYPLQLTSGTVLVGPDAVEVKDIKATGPHGGFGEMSGVVAKVKVSPGHDRWDPDLHITRAQLPLDELLLATIPAPHDHWLREFRLQGTLDATGRIFAQPDGQVTFAIDTHLHHATADPFASGFAITDLAGDARIERGSVTVTNMTGRRGDSALTLDGQADWSASPAKLTMTVTGKDLRFEPQLLGLSPPDVTASQRARQLFETHKPAGRFDGTFRYVTGGETGPRFDLDVQPKELAFDLRGKRVAFTDMTGRVSVNGDSIQLHDMTARFENGKVSSSGLISTGHEPAAAITFSAEATKVDDLARAALPPAVVRTIDGLALDGAYTIPRARYVQRSATNDQPRMEFEGTVQLQHAVANVGVPITEVDGELYVLATQPPAGAWPRLDIRLDAKRLLAAGRVVEPLQMHLVTSDQREDLLHLQQLRGVCYGGLLVGEGWIDLARNGLFRVAATLSEVALEPFRNPTGKPLAAAQMNKPDRPATDAVNHDPTDPLSGDSGESGGVLDDQMTPDPSGDRTKGVLTAGLTIEGIPGNVESRRGRGELNIRNASLYELPMALAALQIANLTLPQSNAFDRAGAKFIIDGDTIRFDSIRFEAPTVEMSGDGTMQLSTRRLNLELVSRNPAALQLGAVSELFNVVKDELITIRVTGTLDDPKAKVASLRGVKGSMDRVFGDDKPDRPHPDTDKRRQSPPPEGRDDAADNGSAKTSGQ